MIKSSYKETLEYLYSHLPLFSKLGASAIKKDLTNTIELCERLGNPHNKFKCIHVAGTNGKGSTSHMLAAILQISGYKTGLYTSPHLKDFRERIRINGEMISEKKVVDFTVQIKKDIEEIEPSFFEVTVTMAFKHFAEEEVDIAVIETGLGGRLDSTNVITPLLSVITNIGYDHMNILGNTLKQIASEKAGIIKHKVPVVIGERHPETEQVFINKAMEEEARIVFAEDEWGVEEVERLKEEANSSELIADSSMLNAESSKLIAKNSKLTAQSSQLKAHSSTLTAQSSKLHTLHLHLDLTGSYQQKNLKTVLSAVDELRKQRFVISDEHLKQALSQVQKLTGLQGRWQTLGTGPLIICDTGHNSAGMKEVVKNISATPYKNLHMVFGMVKDKDISKVLALLPQKAKYYFCNPPIERAKPARELAEEAKAFNLHGEVIEDVASAFQKAKDNAEAKDLIFVGGSTFVVAEII